MRVTSLLLVAMVFVSGCDNDNPPTIVVNPPTGPSAPSVPACQANHTADVSFQNLTEIYMDVILDGLYLGTLPPESPPGFEQAVSSDIAHRLDWRETNTQLMPCQTTRPIAVQCSKVIWTSCYGFGM